MWFFSRKTRRASKVNAPRSRCRLQLETLEDRCLLSSGLGSTVTSLSSGNDIGAAVAVQSNGQIVVAGTANQSSNSYITGTGTFAVVRYNADLTLDTSFGNQGIKTTAITAGQRSDANALVIQPADGKLVVAGWTNSGSVTAPKDNFAVARYTTSGALDATFGGGKGYVVTDVGKNLDDFGQAVALDARGNIVVAGYARTSKTNANLNGFAVARYTPAGALDTTFNSRGILPGTIVSSPVPGDYNKATSVAIYPATDPNGNAGKILVGGFDWSTNRDVFERFNANGTLDSTFGNGGIVVAPVMGNGSADNLQALAIDSSGRVVAVGQAGNVSNGFGASWALVARFTATGTLDTSFGNGAGYVVSNWSGVGNDSKATSIVLQPADGKIVVAGYDSNANTYEEFTAARYNTDGSPDTTFNGTGVLRYAFSGSSTTFQHAQGVALTPTGSFVLAGFTSTVPVNKNLGVLVLDPGTVAAPQVSSFTASPAGSSVTLTANVQDVNPGSTITQVAFYIFSSTTGLQLAGYGTQTSPGVWTFSLAGLSSGSYTLYAQAEDSYGVFGDPLALTLQVI
jgi:uncharacterized delta-60 repeat protein